MTSLTTSLSENGVTDKGSPSTLKPSVRVYKFRKFHNLLLFLHLQKRKNVANISKILFLVSVEMSLIPLYYINESKVVFIGNTRNLEETYRCAAKHRKNLDGMEFDDFVSSDSKYYYIKKGKLESLSETITLKNKIKYIEQLTDDEKKIGE